MFCSNCGKQLPDNTKFCNACGAKQLTDISVEAAAKTAENRQNAGQTSNQPKKTSIVLVLIIVLAAFLLGKFVIAPSMTSNSGEDPGKNTQSSQSQLSNPAYDAVFDGTYIVHFQALFNMEMGSFALKQADGTICCADYGYQNDVVRQWVETMYIPVGEYTDGQKAELESTMKTQFAAVEALNCCTVTYKMGANYLIVTCTYADVDQAENYTELYNAGILQTNTFISMSATEEALLNQGFVKK